MPRVPIALAYAAAAALLASAAPLVAYAGSLALFGLPHVLTELRYVDGRFGRRLGAGRVTALVGLLLLAVALRTLGWLGRVDPQEAFAAELGVVAVLAFVTVPDLVHVPWMALLALAGGGALALGSWQAPVTTLTVLAILHNLTPWGFLAERAAPGAPRRRVAALGLLLFVGVPVVIALGGLAALWNAGGLPATTGGFGSVGTLSMHRGVFVPAAWLDRAGATDVFSAVTYLQLMHYGVVLLVMPRLLAGGAGADRPRLPWPRARWLAVGIAAVGLVATVGFVRDFGGTRAAYGVVASVHAWIEVPMLLWFLVPPRRPLPGRHGA